MKEKHIAASDLVTHKDHAGLKKVVLPAMAVIVVAVVAFMVVVGVALHKDGHASGSGQMGLESRPTASMAYMSDIQNALDKRIAMFVIPVNYTTNGPWTSFELKASTNNFYHGHTNEIPEEVYMQYFMDSDVADVGGLGSDQTFRDRAKLYVVNEGKADIGLEKRSYTRIANTAVLYGIRHVEEVVVLVDAHDLIRHPEEWKCENPWLTSLNEHLTWIYGRKGVSQLEEARGSKPMWRPVAPVCWFKEMPNWSQLADEEYYQHFPTNAPAEVEP